MNLKKQEHAVKRNLGRMIGALLGTSTLVGTVLLTGGPAAAASSYYTLTLGGTSYGSCSLAEPNPSVNSHVGGGVGLNLRTVDQRLVKSGANIVGIIDSEARLAEGVSLSSGGLRAISISTSGIARIGPGNSADKSCADSAHRIAAASASTSISSTQNVGPGAGWLSLSLARSAGYSSLHVDVYSGGAKRTAVNDSTAARQAAYIYLPAGGTVVIGLSAHGGGNVGLTTATTGVVSRSWSATLHGSVTPIGWATSAVRGPAKARSAAVLPTAVSCASHRAGIGLTKYAKKRASSVTISVNGKVKKKIKKIRPRSYPVSVPAKGAITVKAKVKLKSGRTVAVKRSYAACR